MKVSTIVPNPIRIVVKMTGSLVPAIELPKSVFTKEQDTIVKLRFK